MKTHPLKSSRLILRNWKLKEAPFLVELAQDKKLIFGTMPHPYTLQDAQAWIKEALELKDLYYFAITCKKKIIGVCWLKIRKNKGNLVYGIQKEFRGKGYATEAARILVDFGQKELKLQGITAETSSKNKPSHQILKKLGFTIVKKDKERNKFTKKLEEKGYWELK